MKRVFSLLLILILLSFSLVLIACNGDEPQGDGGVTDGTPPDGTPDTTPDGTPDTPPDGAPDTTPEYGDNVVDFDTIA